VGFYVSGVIQLIPSSTEHEGGAVPLGTGGARLVHRWRGEGTVVDDGGQHDVCVNLSGQSDDGTRYGGYAVHVVTNHTS